MSLARCLFSTSQLFIPEGSSVIAGWLQPELQRITVSCLFSSGEEFPDCIRDCRRLVSLTKKLLWLRPTEKCILPLQGPDPIGRCPYRWMYTIVCGLPIRFHRHDGVHWLVISRTTYKCGPRIPDSVTGQAETVISVSTLNWHLVTESDRANWFWRPM